MSDADKKLESNNSEVAPAKQKDGKWKIGNLLPALSKSWDKFKESKDQNFLMKVGIFFNTFFEEMKGVDEEKKEVTKETQVAVAKGVGETMAAAKTAAKLDGSVEKPDQEFYDEVLAMAVASNEELDAPAQTAVHTGLAKLDKAVKGETPEASTFDEVKAMGATGLLTISKLRAKFPDAAKFKEALDKLDKISDHSAYPLKKLLSIPVLKIFKVQIDVASEGIQGVGAALGISEKGEGMKLLDSFQLSVGDAMKLKGLKEQPVKDEPEVIAIMKRAIFPNTSEAGIKNIVKILNKLMTEKPDHVDTQTFADLVFNIDEKDFKRLIEILTGKHGTEMTKAA